MDETIRVRIVADTKSANSSLKNLSKDTQTLTKGANLSNAAIEAINKSLNSVGLGNIKVKATIDIFKTLKTEIKKAGDALNKVNFKKVFKGAEDGVAKFRESVKKTFRDIGSMDFSGTSAKARSGKLVQDLYDTAMALDEPTDDIREVVHELGASLRLLGESRFKYTELGGLQKGQSPYKQLVKDFKELDAATDNLASDAPSRFDRFNNAVQTFQQRLDNILNGEWNKKIDLFKDNQDFGITKAMRSVKDKVKSFAGQVGENLEYYFKRATRRFTLGGRIKDAFSDFGKSFKEIARKIGDIITKTLDTAFNVIKKTIKVGLIGGVVATLVGGIALIKNAFSVSKLGNDIDKTSQKVGMSTKTYQKWSYILERCGVEVSNLKTAMRGLTAATLGNNGEYFKQLGIDPNGMSQNQLFESTVEALQKVEDKTLRAQLAYKLFGRSSAELAPVLALNVAEIQRLSYQYELLGATMDGRVIKASVNMRDALQDLRAAWQGLKNTLAQGLMPIITNIIVRLTVLIAKINMVLKAVFGVDLEYESVVDNTQQVTKNTQETAAAVKKLKTLIAGFDELNIFPSQDNGAGIDDGLLDDLEDLGSYVSPSIGEILPPEAIAELENFRDNILPGIVEKINEWREAWNKLKDAWKTGDFGNFLETLLEVTGLSDIPVIRELLDGLEKLKTWWDEHIGGKMIGWEPIDWDSLFNPDDFWDFMGIEIDENSILGKIKSILDEFQEVNNVDLFGWELPESWEEFFNGGDFLGLDIDIENSPIAQFFRGIGGEIKKWLEPAGEDIKGFFNGIGEWWEEDIEPLFTKEGWSNIFADIKRDFEESKIGVIFTKEYWQTKFAVIGAAIQNVPIVQKLTGVWNTVKGWFNKDVNPTLGNQSFWKGKFLIAGIGLDGAGLPAKVAGVWNSIKTWWSTNVAPKFTITYWQGKFNAIKNGLASIPLLQSAKDRWNSLKAWWDTNIAPKFTIAYWKEKWNVVANGLGYASIMTKVKEKWTEVKSWFTTNVAPKFTWTYWRDKFNSIKTGLSNVSLVQAGKNIINGLINTLETGINRMIDKINSSGIISALKKVGVDITLNRIYIPRLAKGGIIDQPTMAMMGEYPGARNNPEIVTPENKLTEIFQNSNDDIVGVLVQGFRQIVQAIDEKDTSISIGDTTIAKSAARGNQQYRLQTGTSLF